MPVMGGQFSTSPVDIFAWTDFTDATEAKDRLK